MAALIQRERGTIGTIADAVGLGAYWDDESTPVRDDEEQAERDRKRRRRQPSLAAYGAAAGS